jgi:hypothetical protein
MQRIAKLPNHTFNTAHCIRKSRAFARLLANRSAVSCLD